MRNLVIKLCAFVAMIAIPIPEPKIKAIANNVVNVVFNTFFVSIFSPPFQIISFSYFSLKS